MAKLDGVKTLDMVNGEITKVAYDGAEYVKTDSSVQEGDLFLLTEGHLVIGGDTGAFYMANKCPIGGIEIPTRYRGNASAVQKHGNGIAFRKVAASTNPSVEERVAKAEGEIESLKSDVAALKGEPKPERLKVGDYAKVVKDCRDHEVEVGTILLVTIIDDAAPSIKCDDISGNRIGWFFERELVRATDEEVAEAKRAAEFAKFKEGAKVRLKSGGGEFPLNGFENGKIYEVEDEGYPRIAGKYVRIIGGDAFQGFATPDQLEILSEEEAAEHKKWAEIGRKVNEYKKGDVVAYSDSYWFGNSGIGEVVDCVVEGRPKVWAVDYRGLKASYPIKHANLTLVTPVEARFDR
ncbi:hypothetical protein ABEV77_04035 [Bacillus subtilis]